MARANAYQKRFANAAIWPDRRWEISLGFDPRAKPEFSAPLDEYASWFYEAVTAATAMATTLPGVGQTYLEVTRESDGNWLDGGKAYRLRVDAHVPGKQFAEQRLLYLKTGRWRLDFPDRRAPACGRTGVPRPSISSPHCRPPAYAFNDCFYVDSFVKPLLIAAFMGGTSWASHEGR